MKIYLSDLDGTLLDRYGRLSPSSRARLDHMLAQGLTFSFATARGWPGAVRVLGDIPIRIPVIVRNGAYVADYKSGEILHANLMSSDLADHIVSFFKSKNISPAVAAFKNGQERMYGVKPNNEYMEAYAAIRKRRGNPIWTEVESLKPLIDSAVAQFNIIDEGTAIFQYRDALEDLFPGQIQIHTYENAIRPGWRMLSILALQATKGNAAHWLMDHMGSSTDKLVAFGDNHNDISMLKVAGKSIAVGNAQDAVIGIADVCLPMGEEDSVVNYIEEDWRK